MISYVKIYGPPLFKAIKTLEKIAIEEPKVCIMDSLIEINMTDIMEDAAYAGDYASNYFGPLVTDSIEQERCDKIISRSGEKLGDYDFFFEWFKKPTSEDLNGLIEKIDAELAPLGCRYTITTK